MKRTVLAGSTAIAAAILLTTWASLLASANTPVPAEAEVRGPQELHPSSILRVEVFSDLTEMSRASDLIVMATAIEQERFPDHDDMATLTTLKIVDVLKGEAAETIELYSLGLAADAEGYEDIPEVADPPLLGETYVFHLAAFTELTDAKGDLVSRDDLWRPIQFSQYRVMTPDTMVLDDDQHPDAIPRRVSYRELITAATS